MLLLGVVVGAAIGAALYFLFPFPASSPNISLPQIEVSTDLEEADRLFIAGQDGAAKTAYLSVISQGSNSPRPYNNLASLYAAEGDLDQAQDLLNKALATDPDYLTVYHNVGKVYAAMARDSYGKALQLERDTKPLRLQTLGVRDALPTLAQVVQPQEPVTEAVLPVADPSAQMTIAKIEKVHPAPDQTTEAQNVPEPAGAELSLPESGTLTGAVSVVASEPIAPLDLKVPVAETTVLPQQFLEEWAQAWSSQEIERYLQSYASDFTPVGEASSQAWQESRRRRLGAPTFIKVSLSGMEVTEEKEGVIRVQAIQDYRSDRYQDRTRKSFVLRRRGQTWEIIEEKSLGRVR
jgi:tetratricopeptide (TPR) repeat protein